MWTGTVVAVDQHGNLVTNFISDEVQSLSEKAKVWIELPGRPDTIRSISKTFTDVAVGKVLAVQGSKGYVEISVRDGDAAKTLSLRPGDTLKLHFRL